jgi:hypothetical protein
MLDCVEAIEQVGEIALPLENSKRIPAGSNPSERRLRNGEIVTPSDSWLTLQTISKHRGSPMNALCKPLIWSFLCGLLATRVQGQETEQGEAVFCDTKAQVEQFAAYYENGSIPDPRAAACVRRRLQT